MARETAGSGQLNSQLGAFVSLAGLAMIASAVLFYGKSTPYSSLFTLLPVLGAVLVILLASPENFAGRVSGTRPLIGIGLISYSAYLWYQPIFAFARRWAIEEPGPLAVLAMVGLAFGLAYLSWRQVERPYRNKSSIGSRGALIASPVCVLFFWVFALHGNYGVSRSHIDPSIEEEISDRYITWGWTDRLPQHTPGFIFKTAGNPSGKYNPAGSLLLIETRLNHRITTWDGMAEFGDYFHEQQRFISALATSQREDLTVRLHAGYRTAKWSEELKWQTFDP